jgi:hypothetical protein
MNAAPPLDDCPKDLGERRVRRATRLFSRTQKTRFSLDERVFRRINAIFDGKTRFSLDKCVFRRMNGTARWMNAFFV